MSPGQKNIPERRVTREQNSNFYAGYVHVNEDQLHRTGLRGRKKYLVYIVVTLLVLAVLVNLVLTVAMLGILRISKEGMASMEFLSTPERLLFLMLSDMGHVKPIDSTIGTLHDQPMVISGVNGQEVLLEMKKNGSKVYVGPQATVIDTEEFNIVNPDTGRTVFTSTKPSDALADSKPNHLKAPRATTNRITSSLGEDLVFQSRASLTLSGGEGVEGHTSLLRLVAKSDMDIEAKNSVKLSGEEGVLLLKVQQFTRQLREPGLGEMKADTYKLCVGMPGGHLFTVAANATCESA